MNRFAPDDGGSPRLKRAKHRDHHVADHGSSGRVALGAFAALVALGGLHVARPSGLAGEFSYLAVTVGAGCLAWFATRRNLWTRAGDQLIAVALLLSGVGDACYMVVSHVNGAPPDVSIADVFYLASYVALAAGLIARLGLRPGRRTFDVDALIDMGSFVILAIAGVWITADVSAIFADQSVSTLVHLVWAAYPVLDAALLAVVVKALLSRRLWSLPGFAMLFGIGAWLASDFAALLFSDAAAKSTWMDLGWMGGAALMAVAVSLKSPNRPVVTPRVLPRGRVLMSLAPLLVPGIVELWSTAHGSDPNPIPLFAVTAGLIVLAFFRELRLVNARLVQDAEMRRREIYWRSLAGNSADAVIVVDVDGRVTNEAPQLVEMLGKQGAGTVGADVMEFVEPLERARMRASLDWIRTTEGVVADSEFRTQLADGSIRWFSLRAVNPAADLNIGGVIINIHDITDRKRAEAELTQLAFHDALTGLANRSLFHDRVAHAFQRSARSGTDVALVYVDVDGFKMVNDSYGHDAGDHVLSEISARLLAAVRTGDTVARLGGDEFAILLEQCNPPLDEAAAIADRILDSFAHAVEWFGQSIALSASIGVAVGEDRSTATSILRDADVAMYQAKTSGKAKWALFDPEMRSAAIQRRELESDLAGALDDGQFELAYQPVVDLETDELVGFEALQRWNHPTRGLVGPDEFIPIAEANGS
ncbi:MAG: Diguanylate cyclase/phosphodiesterase (modular protein), partial [Ilumatobacteraceae bacterium]|nr:Diguanylate cyclase/phosphodiesterase (modular protein) [Ilumatobacteraceae bacterium]